MKPMVRPLYHKGQFLGFMVSVSSSQSISKLASVVPVVPMDVAFPERGGLLVTRDICGVSAFSRSSKWFWIEIVSAMDSSEWEDWTECAVCGGPFSGLGKDMLDALVTGDSDSPL